MDEHDKEILNGTLRDLARECGLDVAALGPDLVGNLDGLKAAVTAKRSGEVSEWEAHNLAMLEGFLAGYKEAPPETSVPAA